ncbi:hypothetical protein LDVICp024 [lymphocystis disease virus-China]|uniref:Uncharacterized protein n=2 Tax=Lymphocystis disease virus 2 TaxID=159183 RepID=A0A6F8X2D8_9VIRU|nr:hypothetical protein LDVICp024 [lymphocystis disease virus-China]AAU10872.1 hypothetical protein [lymphocystis disease virus-China]BCB67426.1 hypothetical protein [Lymphocystis disease virus 2]
MFRPHDKSVSGLFYKRKSATLDDKRSFVINKSTDDYMEMCFKPQYNKKTNVFVLTPHIELDSIKYTYPLQGGTLKFDIKYKPEINKNGLTDLKIVLDYQDSILKIDHNTF